jgi:hypothetical protein
MESLPPSSDDVAVEVDPAFEEFERRWARSEELRDILERLPGRLVLKSGMSGQRAKLLERWELIELPGLDDDSPSSELLDTLRMWIRDAEALVRYIIQIGDRKTESAAADTKDEELSFEVVESADELDAIIKDWHWPWAEKAIEKSGKNKVDVTKVMKYGAIGVGVLFAISKWVEE